MRELVVNTVTAEEAVVTDNLKGMPEDALIDDGVGENLVVFEGEVEEGFEGLDELEGEGIDGFEGSEDFEDYGYEELEGMEEDFEYYDEFGGMEEGFEYYDEFGDMGEGYYEEGYDMGMGPGMDEPKNPLLSSWGFVIGITVVVLLVGVAVGTLLARLKIKKGIELYEDY